MSDNTPTQQCYGGHPYPMHEMYSYLDKSHGITADVRICPACLYRHVHKYWPGSPNELMLLDKYPELCKAEAAQMELFDA